jgi:hypothetical protein
MAEGRRAGGRRARRAHKTDRHVTRSQQATRSARPRNSLPASEGTRLIEFMRPTGAANPPPELSAWSTIDSPDERLRVALCELYGFYHRTERMLENLFRDESTVPLVQERFAAFRAYFAAARDTLMAGRKLRGAARRRTQAALGHAIAFSTWKSFLRGGAQRGRRRGARLRAGCSRHRRAVGARTVGEVSEGARSAETVARAAGSPGESTRADRHLRPARLTSEDLGRWPCAVSR